MGPDKKRPSLCIRLMWKSLCVYCQTKVLLLALASCVVWHLIFHAVAALWEFAFLKRVLLLGCYHRCAPKCRFLVVLAKSPWQHSIPLDFWIHHQTPTAYTSCLHDNKLLFAQLILPMFCFVTSIFGRSWRAGAKWAPLRRAFLTMHTI